MPSVAQKRRKTIPRSQCQDERSRQARLAERAVLAIDAIAEGIYEWRIDTGELWVSEQLNEILGFESGELTPQGWTARLHPDDTAAYRAALAAHFKGETSRLSYEYRVRRHDGTYLWVRDTGRSVRRADGRAAALVGGIIDISKRKAVEDGMRRSEERNALAMRAVEWACTTGTSWTTPSTIAQRLRHGRSDRA